MIPTTTTAGRRRRFPFIAVGGALMLAAASPACNAASPPVDARAYLDALCVSPATRALPVGVELVAGTQHAAFDQPAAVIALMPDGIYVDGWMTFPDRPLSGRNGPRDYLDLYDRLLHREQDRRTRAARTGVDVSPEDVVLAVSPVVESRHVVRVLHYIADLDLTFRGFLLRGAGELPWPDPPDPQLYATARQQPDRDVVVSQARAGLVQQLPACPALAAALREAASAAPDDACRVQARVVAEALPCRGVDSAALLTRLGLVAEPAERIPLTLLPRSQWSRSLESRTPDTPATLVPPELPFSALVEQLAQDPGKPLWLDLAEP